MVNTQNQQFHGNIHEQRGATGITLKLIMEAIKPFTPRCLVEVSTSISSNVFQVCLRVQLP